MVFLLSVLLLPLLGQLAVWLHSAATGAPFGLRASPSELSYDYAFLFVLGGALAEEYGWSYLADRLDERIRPLAAMLLLGTIWALWHLPLFFLDVPGVSQRFMPFGSFLALSPALRALFSWAYERNGHKILSNLLFHNAINMTISVVAIVPQQATLLWSLWLLRLALSLSPDRSRSSALRSRPRGRG